MARDWKKEKESATESNYLKLEAGQHKVAFLNDGGEEYPSEFKDDKGVVSKLTKVDFLVECNGKQATWSITKSNGKNGLWQQLASVGVKRGSLRGQILTILVKGSGKSKDYTVVEAME